MTINALWLSNRYACDKVAVNVGMKRTDLWQAHSLGLSHDRVQRLAGQDGDGCEGVVVSPLLDNALECGLEGGWGSRHECSPVRRLKK